MAAGGGRVVVSADKETSLRLYLAPRTMWHRGQFGTTDNLAPRTCWHCNKKRAIIKYKVLSGPANTKLGPNFNFGIKNNEFSYSETRNVEIYAFSSGKRLDIM